MSGAGEDDNVSIDDDRQQFDEEGEEELIGTMSNRDQEGEEQGVEEEEVNIDGEEEEVNVDGEEEEVNVDGDEEEENVEVVDAEGENVELVFGEQQHQQPPPLPQKVEVVYGEEENVDVDVDIVDEDEPPVSSISVLVTDDPFSSASNSGVDHTAGASSTYLNTAEDELASYARLSSRSSSPDHPHAPFIVARPRGMPNPTGPNTSIPGAGTTTTLAAADDESTPTTDGGVSPTVQIASGADVFEVTTAAGLQFISSKMVDVPPIQDLPNPEIKDVYASPLTGIDLASANAVKAAPVDDLKEPPPIMDGKSPGFLFRKNSIPDRDLKLDMQTENALRKLPSQASSVAPELKQTGLLMKTETEVVDARASENRDQLASMDAGGAAVQESENKSAAKDNIESSSSSNHDARAFDGLNALTSAIDIGHARDALAKLQPKLNDGAHGGGGEGSDDPGGSNSAERSQRVKTELEREMELYEEAEKEEEARLLASMRSDQSVQQHGDAINERKRASESIPNEARKKRGKRVVSSDERHDNDEDVCFICFDGGDLVLCDRRTCSKAYHLNCIGRDIAFFEKKGAWICGWHFCSMCTKPANFQCYTCPTAYCSSCLSKADFHIVRHRKGFCEECWPIVQMIENKETVDLTEGVEVDFTDPDTYECLFKDYWEILKRRLSITSEELDRNGEGAGGSAALLDSAGSDGEDKSDADYDTSSGDEMDEEEDEEEEDMEAVEAAKKRKGRRGKAKTRLAEGVEGDTDLGSENDDDDDEDVMDLVEEGDDEKPSVQPREFDGWASKELIEFVKYMNEDPKKPLSRFQVTKLLWSYIKSQKLQDPRKKTQIQCDDRLRTIFGKKTVGQFEMFKHLQSHFAPKGLRRAGRQMREEEAAGMEEDGADADGSAVDDKYNRVRDVKDRRRRRKADEDKFERPNVDEFAAVTPKNIGLIYLRRQLLEELLDDPEFDSKVCNTFVRIRVPGMMSKSEMCYRLVQVVGTRLQAEQYKAGRKFTNYVLEILNLQKREDVTVDLVSNHDFNEEECQRLRQSIKCGFIRTLTVGDIEEKARSLQEAKVNDWFETERQRLVNLRDRASEKGRKKELRECVEKLQELNSPAFRAAKLHARPEVTADPRMDPNYESDTNEDKGRDAMSSILDKSLSPGDKILPASILKGGGFNEGGRMDWEGVKMKHSAWADTNRVDRGYDSARSSDKQSLGRPAHGYGVESAKERGYEERDRGWGMEQQNEVTGDGSWMGNGRNRATPAQKWNEKMDLSINVDARPSRTDYRGGFMTGMTTPVFDTKADWQSRREPAPPAAPSLPQGFPPPPPPPIVMTPAALEAAEKEKIWHYLDPSRTVQGPFAMEQLRKWNTTGYFPEDLRIWKTTQVQEESILLNDALAGRFQKDREPAWASSATRAGNPVVASIQEEIAQALTTSSTLPFNNNPAKSADGWRENGGASSWTDNRGYGDVGRSGSLGAMDVNQNNRPFSRDSVTGPTAPIRDNSLDMKWKPGPAGGAYDSYGRSTYNSSTPRSGRSDGKFDPSWGSRSGSGRPERDGWGSSPAPGNDGGGGGYSNLGGRNNSFGRGSSYRDSGGKWNPDDSDGSRSSSRSATRAARKDIPCRFHQKGYCKRGDSCDFWHG